MCEVGTRVRVVSAMARLRGAVPPAAVLAVLGTVGCGAAPVRVAVTARWRRLSQAGRTIWGVRAAVVCGGGRGWLWRGAGSGGGHGALAAACPRHGGQSEACA
jgi:hypothetical protein